ncbi:hypothetical protein VNO77_02219 [Canavalia gladiata]|uniref:Nitrate regulatory gene2 protein n=1 Tax=Canavalia gladiata TaxID=3824 RepID=A0AAN9MUM4_CANGL
MGCWQSRIEREETVSRCKARKRYMKHFLQARRAFSSAHATYILSLRSTASALLNFANTEQTTLQHHHHLPPQPQPPFTPSSDTWIPATASPPPPPPPPSTSSGWDFWDPFNVPPPFTEEEWEDAAATTTVSQTVPRFKEEELAMVVSRNGSKGLVEVVKEIHDCFLKAADAGAHVSLLLEVSNSAFSTHGKAGKGYGYGCSLSPSLWSWGSSPKLCEKSTVPVASFGALGGVSGNHCSTVERLYTWEKKLCQEVKTMQTILDPNILMCMWRSMYEYHQVQKDIVKQLEYLNTIPSTNPTSESQRQSTLQLELEIQQWHHSFCNLLKAHRDYIHSLTSWLRLSLFQYRGNSLNETTEESKKIYTLCEEWNHAVDRISDMVESEGINTLLTVIHAIVVQQREELKQKKKLEAALKELEKKVIQLQSVEGKYGPYPMLESSDTMRTKVLVTKKRAKVEHLRAKVEEERTKHENSIGVTRTMTLNNLKMGFPQAFQRIVGSSGVCMEIFESIYNKAKIAATEHDVKRILPLEN